MRATPPRTHFFRTIALILAPEPSVLVRKAQCYGADILESPAATRTGPGSADTPQGVGKVGLGDWLGDQVDGSSGASCHGSGGGGDGGCGAVGQADEADGEVAQGGRDQRVRCRCAAGGGPRP